MIINFHFSDSDYCNYLVDINNKTYNISQDNCKIKLEESHTRLNMTLSYAQDKLSFIRIIGIFLLELIKIPFLIIFETISNAKWYENTPLIEFSYIFSVMTDNKDNIDINIRNSSVNYNNCTYSLPDITSDCSIEFHNKKVDNKFSDLQIALLKYCFRVFWSIFALEIIFVLAIKNSVLICVFAITFLLLMIVLIVKAVCKYNKIKSIIEK